MYRPTNKQCLNCGSTSFPNLTIENEFDAWRCRCASCGKVLALCVHTENTAAELPNNEERLTRSAITDYRLSHNQGLASASLWWTPLCYDMKFRGVWIDRNCPDNFYDFVEYVESTYELW